MKEIQIYIIGIIFLTTISSCEKIIDVSLIDSEQRIVIEGVLKDLPGESYILISRTGGVYESSNFEKITNADVRVTDKDGNQYIFDDVAGEPGKYVAPSFVVLPSNLYSFTIDINGELFTATCPTNSKPIIDSLTYQELPPGFGSGHKDLYLVSYHSSDPVDELNYYRARIWLNGDEVNTYYMGDDDFINGQTYEGPFFGAHVHSEDTVFIELLSMDKEIYKYFYQLANNLDQSPFSATPVNPEGNLIGDAIGYLSAFTTDTMTVIIP